MSQLSFSDAVLQVGQKLTKRVQTINALQKHQSMPKTTFRIFILFALALGSISFTSVEAKSTRSFSGSNPAEVEKNAKKAGFDYPDGEMKCSSRCNQRWAKE